MINVASNVASGGGAATLQQRVTLGDGSLPTDTSRTFESLLTCTYAVNKTEPLDTN